MTNLWKERKKDNLLRLSFKVSSLPPEIIDLSGPYRDRTGDLHNAIVALSQTELTAQIAASNIPKGAPKVNEKFIDVRLRFG